MSGQIRRNLGRTLGHARRHHTSYLELKNKHPAPWTELQKASFQAVKVRMKSDVDNFEKYFDQWEAFVGEIDDDNEHDVEENLMNEWMDKPEYDGMICDLKDCIAVIEAQIVLKVISPGVDRTPVPTVEGTDVLQHVVTEVNAVVDSATSQSAVVTADVYSATTQTSGNNVVTDTNYFPRQPQVVKDLQPLPLVSIPTLNIPKFNGDSLKWKAFWQRFDLNIHSRPYPKVQKFDTLLGLLDGRALEEVEGFELSDENYDSVIQILVER
uniref:Uncharacterized protein n=1 Tax=Panagrolaimus sp. ES5 TaxID=591445 RepID=A0AC34GFA8_9BILA